MAYAIKTSVPIDRSKAEVEFLLKKAGATSFMFGSNEKASMIVFDLKGMRIKFLLPMPIKPPSNCSGVMKNRYDQECRSKWRSLVLCIKAKLESVESEITTLEQEFLAHIVLPNGMVVGEFAIPQIVESYKTNEMPLLLG